MPDSQQIQSPAPVVDPQLPPAAPTQLPKNGLGLAALIVGAAALLGALIPFINYGSGLVAVVGIVLGIIALARKGRAKRIALAGLIVSAVALVLSIILAIVYTAGFISAVDDSLGTSTPQQAAEQAPDAAEPAPDAESGASEVGTRANPAPLGTVVELTSAGAAQYDVTLGAATLMANDAVAAANEFNDAPGEGFQYAIVPVTVTYTGTETGTPWIDLTIEFVSEAGTTHTTSDTLAVGPAPSIMDINDLYPDASGTGNVVIAIPTADAALGTWTVSTMFGDPFFYAAQ